MSADVSERIKRLCVSHGLTGREGSKLERIVGMLTTDPHAPTSVRDPALAVDVHMADSLEALNIGIVRKSTVIADIGAGSGLPGLPLAVALPDSRVALVESQVRKCAFMERVRDATQIENAVVICSRAEEWTDGIGAHEMVLARAVAAQPVVLEYAAPLLRLGGALVDWRGRRDPEEERSAAVAAELLGLRLESIQRVEPYEGVRDHHLHVYLKVEETPERFPRRAGMARKKPLVA
jgi:16S rRNA (guanine527-N7)-methyltransferase